MTKESKCLSARYPRSWTLFLAPNHLSHLNGRILCAWSWGQQILCHLGLIAAPIHPHHQWSPRMATMANMIGTAALTAKSQIWKVQTNSSLVCPRPSNFSLQYYCEWLLLFLSTKIVCTPILRQTLKQVLTKLRHVVLNSEKNECWRLGAWCCRWVGYVANGLGSVELPPAWLIESHVGLERLTCATTPPPILSSSRICEAVNLWGCAHVTIPCMCKCSNSTFIILRNLENSVMFLEAV